MESIRIQERIGVAIGVAQARLSGWTMRGDGELE